MSIEEVIWELTNLIFSLPLLERSDLTGHCGIRALVWLLVWLVACGSIQIFSDFKNVIRFQKF